MPARNGESAARRRLLQSQPKAPVPSDQTRRRPTAEWDRAGHVEFTRWRP